MSDIAIASKLMDACEQVLCDALHLDDVTVRKVVARAGVNVSAISYHFGSHEKLIFAVGQRVYQRLNAERLTLLQRAIDRSRPGPPALEELIEALVGPSVRWSLNPSSGYRVLSHFTTMMQRGKEPELYRSIIEGVEHHRAFVRHFQRIAPWLSEADVGWRINCALGIRSQFTRHRQRVVILTNNEMDFDDADVVIAGMVAVIAPMFRREAGFGHRAGQTVSNSVSKLSRS